MRQIVITEDDQGQVHINWTNCGYFHQFAGLCESAKQAYLEKAQQDKATRALEQAQWEGKG